MTKKLESSNVRRIQYDKQTGILEVTFERGATYKYENITPQRYRAFINSDSLGAYVNLKLKELFDGKRIK